MGLERAGRGPLGEEEEGVIIVAQVQIHEGPPVLVEQERLAHGPAPEMELQGADRVEGVIGPLARDAQAALVRERGEARRLAEGADLGVERREEARDADGIALAKGG